MLPPARRSPIASTVPGPVPGTPGRARSRTLRYSIVLLTALATVGALKVSGSVVVPVLFALFITLLLSPTVDLLVRRGLPRVIAAVLVMMTVVALVAACISATWRPAREWLDAAPTTMRTLEAKIKPMTRFIAKVESVSSQAERITEPTVKSRDEPTSVAVETKGFVESTQEWLVAIVSMFFLSLFLLAADLANLGRETRPGSNWGRSGQVFERVRGELARYFAAVTFSNLLLGVATAAAMAWLGMPNPLLWGLIAFVFNFVPYAGSATTLALLTVVALVSFDGIGKAVSVAGTYLVLTTLEGQMLQPVLVGRRLDISPPLVLLGLWFGGWLWGVAGIALATPLLVTIKIAAEELSRAQCDVAAEQRIDSVRTRASQWLAGNILRHRRTQGRAG
jgi:predicted PurR-regulated permease PerM